MAQQSVRAGAAPPEKGAGVCLRACSSLSVEPYRCGVRTKVLCVVNECQRSNIHTLWTCTVLLSIIKYINISPQKIYRNYMTKKTSGLWAHPRAFVSLIEHSKKHTDKEIKTVAA